MRELLDSVALNRKEVRALRYCLLKMAAEQRALLAALMGESEPDDPGSKLDIMDTTVCRHYLVGCCPSHCLAATKVERRPCSLVHSDILRKKYQEQIQKVNYGFERATMDLLIKYVDDCDRNVKMNKNRIRRDREDGYEVRQTALKINELKEQAEKAGEDGDVRFQLLRQ